MTWLETMPIGVAVAASAFDLYSRRIPNALTFGAAAIALVVAAAAGGASGLGASLSGLAIGFALWFPIYLLGGIGAGDVKLMAAIGAWLGPGLALYAGLYAGIVGGTLGVSLALAHGCARQTMANVQLLLVHWRFAGFTPHAQLNLATATGPRLPYAVPILAGTVMALWLR